MPRKRRLRDIDKGELADAFIALALAPEDSPEQKALMWAIDIFVDACWNNPEFAFEAALEVMSKSDDARVLVNLAAWPMERLLERHGEQYIKLFEDEARSNAMMANVLGCMRQSWIDDAVWVRVKGVAAYALGEHACWHDIFPVERRYL